MVILGFWTSLFLTSCSKDDQIEKLEETSTENNINQSTIASTIPINEIPEIHEYLGHITNGTFAFDLNGYTVKAASQSKASDSIGALQFENVIKVTQGEYSKYTFRVKTEKWNTFNLIVKEHTKGLSHFFIEYRGALVTNYQTGRQSFSGKILTYNKLGILSGSADIDSGRSKNGFGGSGECPDGDPNNGGLPGNGGSGSGAAGPGNYAGTPVGDYGGMFNFSGFLLSHFSLGTGGGGMGTIADDSNSSNPSDDSNCHDAPLVVGFLDCNKSSTDIRNEERVLLINLSSTFKSSDCPDDGIVGGNLDNAAYNALVYDLKRIAGLSESQKSFLIQNTSPDFVFNALDYLHDENNNADSKSFIRQLVSTLQSKGHASITLRLIIEGDIPFEDKIVDFLANSQYSFEAIKLADELVKAKRNGSLVSDSPFVKYPKDKADQYKRDYPEFTEFLKNEIPKIANNDKIINEIKGITDAPIETIKEALQWGKGPEIEIKQLGGEGENELYGVYRGAHVPELRNTLFIDIDLVNDLENLENSIQFREEIGFLIAVTILHEYNHLGDAIFGDLFWEELHSENPINENEAGAVFETTIFGVTVWRSNVGLVMRNFGNW